MTSNICKICLHCGQPIRPLLYLKDFEVMELERLQNLGDWRAWAKKVLELSEPKKYAASKLLHDAISGNLTPEEFEKRSEELTAMQEDSPNE